MSMTDNMIGGLKAGAVGGVVAAAAFGTFGLLMGRVIHSGAVHTAKVLSVYWGVAIFANIFASQLPNKESDQQKIGFSMLTLGCVGSIFAMRHHNIIAKTGTIVFSILTTLIGAMFLIGSTNRPLPRR